MFLGVLLKPLWKFDELGLYKGFEVSFFDFIGVVYLLKHLLIVINRSLLSLTSKKGGAYLYLVSNGVEVVSELFFLLFRARVEGFLDLIPTIL